MKSYDQPRQHIKKQRHYFADKSLSSQSYGFSSSHVWMWELTLQKAERWRIDAFELWYWRSLLRVPWTARRSNQSFLKDINPEFSFERQMLKMKLQYSGHLMWRTDLLKKTLVLRNTKGRKRRGATEDEMAGWHHWLDGCESEWTPGIGDGQGGLACCDSWGRKELDTTEWLNWTLKRIRQWHPTPVLWPGEVHGLYSPWRHKESDMK